VAGQLFPVVVAIREDTRVYLISLTPQYGQGFENGNATLYVDTLNVAFTLQVPVAGANLKLLCAGTR
jgi:hypothetical protein